MEMSIDQKSETILNRNKESSGNIANLSDKIRELFRRGSPIIKDIAYPEGLFSALDELDQIVEMEEVKSSILQQIQFLIVNLTQIKEDFEITRKNFKGKKDHKFEGHLLNTVLYGPPGVGKTKIGKILARIWLALGLIKPIKKSVKTPTIEEKIKDAIYTARIAELKSNLQECQNRLKEINTTAVENREKSVQLRKELLQIEDCRRSDKYFPNYSSQFSDELRNSIHLLKGRVEEDKSSLGKSDNLLETSGNLLEKSLVNLNNLLGKSRDLRNINEEIITLSSYLPEEIEDPKPLEIVEPTIKIVSREDFVAKYVGQTAIKTQELLIENIGKVLFIDEAYSLYQGPEDNFGHEALTVLNRFMSEHPEAIIIIAGYRDQMEERFFKGQDGLRRRFTWFFEMKKYSPSGLSQIFTQQLANYGWKTSPEVDLPRFFEQHGEDFPAFGGDTERFAFYCKLNYSTAKFDTVFTRLLEDQNITLDNLITEEILQSSLKQLKSHTKKEDSLPFGMYN